MASLVVVTSNQGIEVESYLLDELWGEFVEVVEGSSLDVATGVSEKDMGKVLNVNKAVSLELVFNVLDGGEEGLEDAGDSVVGASGDVLDVMDDSLEGVEAGGGVL